jgi:hypothetical protein
VRAARLLRYGWSDVLVDRHDPCTTLPRRPNLSRLTLIEQPLCQAGFAETRLTSDPLSHDLA